MTGNFPPRRISNPRRVGLGLVSTSLVSASALLWASQAFADTTISSDTSTTIQTATVNKGAPDNVIIGSGVNVTPPSGAGVIINSDNTVTNNGTIKFHGVNDVTGILGQGGFTSGIVNNGAITLTEDIPSTDTNNDGVNDGPFATGTDRIGIQVTGTSPFVGDISNAASGAISIIGNKSYGISIEAPLTGNLSTLGAISMIGDNSIGLRTTGPVSGTITVGGTIAAQGQAAQAASIGGDVGGEILINGVVSSTGYRVPIRSTDPNAVAKLLPGDLLQGGPAVSVSGGAASGLLVDSTGSVSASSSAPGLVVGAVGRDITFGNVGASPDNFGIENRGTITGAGIYDHISSTALQIGVAGGGAVNTTGGVHNTGTISSSSFIADSTAVLFTTGAEVPLFQQDGTVSALVSTASGNTARGILIQAGANVPTIANSAVIQATVSGTSGDAIAIQDLSGTLTTIQNIHSITAGLTSASGAFATGRAIAIDVSANTSGVSYQQFDTSGGTSLPSVVGSILFGSGNDTASIQAGTLVGDLSFGAGANTLSITGGAQVAGGLTANGGTLALSMDKGSLTITGVDHVNLTSLTLTGNSALTFTADPVSGANTELDVAGAANLASGAKIGLRFASILQGSETFTVIRASQLNVGTLDTSLLGQVPFLYTATLVTDPTQGTLAVAVSTKTPTQLGLSSVAAPALNPVLAAVGRSPNLQAAFLAQSDAAGFHSVFNQLLPSRSSAIFEMTAADSAAIGRAIDDRQGIGGGAWAQEINYGATDRGRDGLPGYNAWGVGLMGGYELALARPAIFGITFGASSSDIRELSSPDTGKETLGLIAAGLYWRATAGRFSADARVGGDYLRMSEDRAISIDNPIADAFQTTATSHWTGTGINARFRAGYEAQWRSVFFRPNAGVDYDQISEDAHTETGGAEGVNLAINARTSSRMSAYAGMTVGALFGQDTTWGPEFSLGYRDVVNENLGDTTARFVSGGDPFTLASEKLSGQGVAAHLALKGENGYGGFAVEGGAETRDGLTVYDLRLTAHLQF